ncbi:FAD:protein FMN transferase [Candidatus Shapirobacteria bacterium]|nr:FAD:protein FMN transferase [Candidatus Shapirobacteria bacterium]
MNKLKFEAIGTHWTIDVGLSKSSSDDFQPHLKKIIFERIEEFEKNYSRFRDDSLVAKMAEGSGNYKLPADGKKLLDIYQKIYQLSNGAVTPLIGKVLVEAGYDEHYSLTPKSNRTPPPKWEEVMDYKFPQLSIKKPVQLDFGAGGKGYLIDLVGEILVKNEIKNYCVEAGGDMVYKTTGEKKLRVGLENPNNVEQAIGVVEIGNQAICGSAGNRRAWGEINHIIDPRNLKSPKEIAGVWVIAKDTLTADMLTTGLYFVKPEILQENFEFEYLKLMADMRVEKSNGFEAELFY